MIYPVEWLEETADKESKTAEILNRARRIEEGRIAQGQAAYAVKHLFILHGLRDTAQWALEHISGFAPDMKAAKKRVSEIIAGESSGDADLDNLCEQYRQNINLRKRKSHSAEYLESRVEVFNRAAQLIREGQHIRKAQNLPEIDEAALIREIKAKYIELQNAGKVAQWAFDTIPGFAASFNKAKERVNWMLDVEESGDEEIDKQCKESRQWNKQAAIRAWG